MFTSFHGSVYASDRSFYANRGFCFESVRRASCGGTFIAANWARIAGIPVLGVAQFGGTGQKLYALENRDFNEKYASSISQEEFGVLNQDTTDVHRLAADVVSLAVPVIFWDTPGESQGTIEKAAHERGSYHEQLGEAESLCRLARSRIPLGQEGGFIWRR